MRKFIVKNTDSYGEKNFEIVEGKVTEYDNRLVYEYESRLGSCELTILDRRVVITRKGEISAIIDVDLDRVTEFLYTTQEMRKLFHIKGEKIERDLERDIVEISYRIYEGEEELNRITIAIKGY